MLRIPTLPEASRALTLSLIATGCSGDEIELPPVRVTLARVEYRSDGDLSRCSGAPEAVQRRVEALESALGIRGPEQVSYVHATRPEFTELWPCSSGRTACAEGARVYSTTYAHHHEVAHAVASALGYPSALLVEGLATAFGYNDVFVPSLAPDWRELVASPAGSGDSPLYASGAALVAWLYRQEGADKLVQLYQSAGTEPDAFARIFSAIYGFPFEEAWQAAHTLVSPYVCAGLKDNTSRGWAESVTGDAACRGPTADARHVLQFDSLTDFAITSSYFDLRVHSCDSSVVAPMELLGAGYDPVQVLHLARWPAGKYFMSRGLQRKRVSYEESLRAEEGSFFGLSCEERVTPLELNQAPERLRLWLDLSRERYLALDWRGESVLSFSIKLDGPALFEACSACDATTCSALDPSHPLSLPPGVTFIRGTPRPLQGEPIVQLVGARRPG